jgi:hypothetical protein
MEEDFWEFRGPPVGKLAAMDIDPVHE